MIRDTGPRKYIVSEVVKELDDTLIQHQDRQVFVEQNTLRSSLVGRRQRWVFKLWLEADQSRWIHQKWRLSARWAFLKRHKIAGSGGLSSSFCEEGGEAVKSELTKIVELNGRKKEIHGDWCEFVIVPIWKKVLDLHVKTTEGLV